VLLALAVVCGALVFGSGVWLAWQNRDSETLRANGTTALLVGLVAGVLTLWFSLKTPEGRTYAFPVVFVIDQASRRPLRLHSAWTEQFFDPGVRIVPETADVLVAGPGSAPVTGVPTPGSEQDIAVQRRLYLEVLVYYVIGILERTFGQAWDVDVQGYETAELGPVRGPVPREPIKAGRSVSRDELVKTLPEYPGLGHWPPYPGDSHECVLPPDTSVIWTAVGDRERKLTMANRFATVTVTIAGMSMWLRGGGTIAALMGVQAPAIETGDSLATLQYQMKLEATFERFLSGHPSMPAHIRWVDALFYQLRSLDAAQLWTRFKQDYSLVRDLEELQRKKSELDMKNRDPRDASANPGRGRKGS